MAQSTINPVAGLRSFKNELTLPAGSLITANNVIVDRDDVIESRRGYALYASFGTSEKRPSQILEYKDRLLVHYDTKLMYDNGSGTLSQFSGVYEALETGLRIKSVEINGNLYFTTKAGIKKISAMSNTEFTTSASYILDSGAPKALDGQGSANIATPGFMDIKSATAYRILWGYKDTNEVLVLGSPSEHFIVRNLDSVNTAVVDLTFSVPSEILNDSKWFYQVYRSSLVDDSTTPGTAIPDDELNLVFEDFPTNTDFSNGYVSIQDITPEDFRDGGALLYTNPISGAGILQANDRPPVARDIVTYKGFTFYSDTKTRHQKQLALISTALLSNDNTLIISDGTTTSTYTFKATENIASKHVLLATGGSVSQNIDDTARSLVRVINRNSGVVYAYYISGPEDVPGQILLESRTLNDVEFYCKVGNAAYSKAFNPALPTGNTELSSNTEVPNRIYYSKQYQPESVPSVNYFDVGEKNKPIKRIVALRDSLFILKGDGIFRLSGNDESNFIVSLSDSSANIIATDSVAVLNNQIFMLSTQGIVAIPESGNPVVVSREIEDLILRPTTRQYTNFATACFGIAYESDRSFLIFLPTETSDTQATQCYRYNVFTRAWTRFMAENPKVCGIVMKYDDKMYLGAGDTNYIEQERKNFDRTDFAERQYTNGLPSDSVNGNYLSINNLATVSVSDVVYQEQYITIARFNRLLLKLDNDILLDDSDYFSSLEASSGDSMANNISLLYTKISTDDALQTYTAPSGSNTITDIRDDFNTLMDELNTSTGVFYGNYRKYTTTVEYEAIIKSIQSNLGRVELLIPMPFLQGDCTTFESIESEIEWSPNTLGDASLMKQFREATIMFDRYNFNNGKVEFRTDLSDSLEGVEFTAEGNGAFGSQVYGEQVYGGNANQRPFRTYIPRTKQRCRFINVKFTHKGARESFAITGYSVTFRPQSTERAYKR